MTMTTSKITQHHLIRQACVYIRQSTPGQVRFNQESTERQYNLMNKAQAFGWSQEQIRVLDGDLGQSGSAAANRTARFLSPPFSATVPPVVIALLDVSAPRECLFAPPRELIGQV